LNEFTGERVIPGTVGADLWNEHISRYRFASQFVRGKRVLDAGCGTGYGIALLADQAELAAGFDISSEAVEYAARHFPGGKFFVASARVFSLPSACFDVVTAFEVIEHLEDWQNLIEESARVLRAGGIFLVSTPNKTYYSETRKKAGPNPFHAHEFDLEEFEQELKRVFPFVRILGQNRQEAILFADGSGSKGNAFVEQEPIISDAHFFLGVCGAEPVEIPCFVYAASGGNLLRERERHIASLDAQVSEARAEHLRLLEEHRCLEAELERHNAWALGLDAELGTKRAELEARQRELRTEQARVDRLLHERMLIARSRWIRLGRAFGVGPQLEDKA